MWRLIVHGGAGKRDANQNIQKALQNIAYVGARGLEAGKSAEEMVELIIYAMESNPVFNVGPIGEIHNSSGEVNLDSSIMRSDLNFGLVTNTNDEHPITIARNIMNGLKNPYKKNPICDKEASSSSSSSFATIGCVALDQQGKICVGKSVSKLGTTNISMIGVDIYCNSKIGVCLSGIGEKIIPYCPSFHLYSLIEYGHYTLEKSMHFLIHNILPNQSAGMIAINHKGDIAYAHNTDVFYVASYRSEDYKKGIGSQVYPEPEYLYNPSGQCPIQRQRAGTEAKSFCPFQSISNEVP